MAWLFSLALLAAAEAEAPPSLLGLEPKEVQALLGDVSLKRWEGPAQMMQFAGECILDVYFYEEGPGAAFRAVHLAARTPAGEAMEAEACLRALWAARKLR